MSKKLSRGDALEGISTWSTKDVLLVLRKHGLEDCCTAVAKRQIDGDELLHLTEGKLALWKSDLTRPLIWSLWSFVEELKRTPEKFIEEWPLALEQNEDQLSDNSSWGTDFEDEANDDSIHLANNVRNMRSISSNKHSSRDQHDAARRSQKRVKERIAKQEVESTYANCESDNEGESTYENYQERKDQSPKNVSRLHNQFEKGLAEQLKEQLKLRNLNRPVIVPKPEILMQRRVDVPCSNQKQPQKSFLHDAPKIRPHLIQDSQKRMLAPPPPEPKKSTDQLKSITRHDKSVPPTPIAIRNLDLVANLPVRVEESGDEYEAFDDQIIEQNQRRDISRVNSKQSLQSGHQSSVESVYQPPSTTSHEEEDEQYEIYESITETPEDNGYYLRPIQRPVNLEGPPPLPAKSVPSSTPSPTQNHPKAEKSKERSPDKKSATLPHSGSNSSLVTERATRPLPPPPDRHSYTDKPWFHNVTREQANAIIKDQTSHAVPQDGYFLLRPSTTNANNPLTLVLWYKDRVYNVPVRKRPDDRYALGSAKTNEQSFTSIEEIVLFYTREDLVLHTGGVQTGSTRLTETAAKLL